MSPVEFHRNKAATVLVVGASKDDRDALQRILGKSSWDLRSVPSCGEACAFLDGNPVPVLICGCDTPSVNWRDLAKHLAGMPQAPRLIVSSRFADEYLWAEVLNLGGYDLLVSPFDSGEVLRIVDLARYSWETERRRSMKSAEMPKSAEPPVELNNAACNV
jgi:DNA-binding NtrC family response regulator